MSSDTVTPSLKLIHRAEEKQVNKLMEQTDKPTEKSGMGNPVSGFPYVLKFS